MPVSGARYGVDKPPGCAILRPPAGPVSGLLIPRWSAELPEKYRAVAETIMDALERKGRKPAWQITKRWDGRVGHPRRVGYLIERSLEEHGFRVQSDPFEDHAGSLKGVATFCLRVTAKKDVQLFSLPQLVLGILTLPLIIGFPLIRAAFGGASIGVQVDYEGEEYLAGAQDETARAERAVVITDCRVDLVARIRWVPWRVFKDEKTFDNLARDVDGLIESVQGPLPNLRVRPGAHRPAIEPSR